MAGEVARCGTCRKVKHHTEFYWDSIRNCPYRRCKDCSRSYDHSRRINRLRYDHLQKRYGLMAGEYERLYNLQKGCCKICNSHFETLNVDHNHMTGQVRGLLCEFCNKAIGLLRDNPLICDSAAIYLRDQTPKEMTLLDHLFKGLREPEKRK